MTKGKGLTALVAVMLSVGLLTAAAMRAQGGASGKPMTLTATDYIEIQQLVNRYADAIDHCGNNGYDYSDLYTADGYFAPSINGKVGTKFQGRERLAEAAGGGVKGCKDKLAVAWDKRPRHLYVNLVITPIPEGAKGKVDLMVGGRDGNRNYFEIQGFYEDTYAKTPNGWRFASRVHNVPSDFTQRGPRPASTSGSQPAQTSPAR